MNVRKWSALLLLIGALTFLACSSSDDNNPNSSNTQDEYLDTNDTLEKSPDALPIRTTDFFNSNGLKHIENISVDGDMGYLTEFSDLSTTPDNPKYCLILTGKPYSMGYQTAYLMPEPTYDMLTTFMKKVGLGQLSTLGISVDPDSQEGQEIFDILYELIKDFSHDSERFIPDNLKEEMRGIVDGMHARGYTDITYEDVLVLNQGVDSTYYLMAAMLGQTPNKEANKRALEAITELLKRVSSLEKDIDVNDSRLTFKRLEPEGPIGTDIFRFGCNEFVIGGSVTENSETMHGRDFMFSTAGVYEDAACVMVYLPEEGSGIPFVAIDPPSFVGHSVGINKEGISIGVDISQGAAFGSNLGVGCLLIDRHVLDTSKTIADSIEAVKTLEKGVQWIYVIADDEDDPVYGCGVELETGKSDAFSGPDMLPEWEQWLLSGFELSIGDDIITLGKDYIGMLSEELPDRGVMVRGTTWIFPSEFSDVNFSIPIPDKYFDKLERTYVGVYFPEQVEINPDILVATNHFIIPRMRFTQLHPLISLIYRTGPLPDSVWRYETQLSYMLSNVEDGIKTKFFGDDPETPAEKSAGWMIDYLNSNREHSWYYGPDHETVEGHHTIMNNTTKDLRSLFGNMDDPWVGANILDFVNWHYSTDNSE